MIVAIVYLPDQSTFTPRVDEFRCIDEEFFRGKTFEGRAFADMTEWREAYPKVRLVWKCRALTPAEFNAEFPVINDHSRQKWMVEPRVMMVDVKESQATPAAPANTKPAAKKAAAPKPKTAPAKKAAPVSPMAHIAA